MEPRRYTHTRKARLSECAPDGRVRLDALARWLGDVASDDVADAGLGPEDGVWIVRRTRLEVIDWPRLGEVVEVSTWANGTGGSVAGRRTSIAGGKVEGAALWVALHPDSRRPARLTKRFWDVYGSSAGAERVSARLLHPDPPPDATIRPWLLRYSDLDVVGHVNNAAYLEAVEEILADTPPYVVEIEYRAGLQAQPDVTIAMWPGFMGFAQDGTVGATVSYQAR